jgi:hypothetical protein
MRRVLLIALGITAVVYLGFWGKASYETGSVKKEEVTIPVRLSALWQAAEHFCEDDQFRLVSIPNDYYYKYLAHLSEAEKALVEVERKAYEDKAFHNRRDFCEEAYARLGPLSWMHRKKPSEILKAEPGEKEEALRLNQLALVAEQYCDFAVDGLQLTEYLRQHGGNYSDEEPRGDFKQLLASALSVYQSEARRDRRMFCQDAYYKFSAAGLRMFKR